MDGIKENRKPRVLILADMDAVLQEDGAYVIRCPSKQIWDGYGSFIRGVLMLVYKLKIDRIEVILTDGKSGPEQWKELMRDNGISEECLSGSDYLLKYLHGLDPARWFEERSALENVRDTVTLLQQHPLLPKNITVTGYILMKGTMQQLSGKEQRG
ncbi:hypothetical protein J9317_03480 [Metabacillus sp. KIGAM252]|uniref:Uncharacterized protein n=1 Tax=Metabacillus flavus TaxID=2823519 RepID=A0ABS5LAU3_9BACI|nr:hypothetical protein [Metabacillus flavus]MBS2967835.1 hypothetical protein [Metabacillus flavus]